MSGRIVSVSDGDTVTLLDASNHQHKVRLEGIDAPEKTQAFGNRSKQSLSDLSFGREGEAVCRKSDRYGRQICRLIVQGSDVGLEQIRRGLAWHYKRYEKEQTLEDRVAYSRLEEDARRAGRGLWSDPSPVPPWEWRAERKVKR